MQAKASLGDLVYTLDARDRGYFAFVYDISEDATQYQLVYSNCETEWVRHEHLSRVLLDSVALAGPVLPVPCKESSRSSSYSSVEHEPSFDVEMPVSTQTLHRGRRPRRRVSLNRERRWFCCGRQTYENI
jgi:hypothetical protein